MTIQTILRRPVLIFGVLALVFGLSSVFNQPPMAVNDEISHFSRAYEISHGTLLTHKLTGRNQGNLGGPVPNAVSDMDALNTYHSYQKPNVQVLKAGIKKIGSVSINQSKKVELTYSNTALYSPLSYLMQALVIGGARLLNLNFLTTLYLTRIAVLLTFIVVTALAIYIMPSKKWFLVVVGLLPMTIQEAASVSIDALIVAFSLLFVASFSYAYSHKSFRFKSFGRSFSLVPIIFLAVLYVSLAKAVYFPLFLSLLLLPPSTFKNGMHKLKTLLLLLAIPFVLMGVWNVAIAHQGDTQAQRLSVNSVGIRPPSTGEGIKSLLHPNYTAKVLFHTYIDQQTQSQVIPDYITTGFFGKFTSYYITPPVWYMLTVGFTLVLAFVLTDGPAVVFSNRLRLLIIGALAIALAGITFSMFFYTTTAGADFINGIQGRYFLPLLGFLLLLPGAMPLLRVANVTKAKLYLVCFIAFNLLFMQFSLYQWFWRG